MRATAVIGAAFGDEGKGLIVDFLAAKDPANTIVVRHNGGAQAGHTVCRPDGRRHAFSHIGAGTFAGAATFLSRYFIVNPLLWEKEAEELALVQRLDPAGLDGSVEKETAAGECYSEPPPLYVDPAAPFTTPYDMLVNQEFERHREKARHGSCGMGINETVTRCATLPGYVGNAASPIWLHDFLRVARDYSLARVKTEVANPSDLFMERLYSEGVRDGFMRAMDAFLKVALFTEQLPKQYERIIFEGAQGLLLDEKHEFFPHVTRSRTGLTNVIKVAARNRIRELDVVYVMRCYMTRHGVGPFPTEAPDLSFEDTTNVENGWQGPLRFGRLDVGLVSDAIVRDLDACLQGFAIARTPRLAVTHLDQAGDAVWPTTDYNAVANMTGVAVHYRSFGPTREDVDNTYYSGTAKPPREATV